MSQDPRQAGKSFWGPLLKRQLRRPERMSHNERTNYSAASSRDGHVRDADTRGNSDHAGFRIALR